MTINSDLRRINKAIFKIFLVIVFFIYYQTKYVPGTIHTWLMISGLVLTAPLMAQRYARTNHRIPLDYFFVLVLLMIIILGFLANYVTATWLDFQAYVLMLATYVYVKENTTADTFEFLSVVIKTFLLINGALVILQLFTGHYFPARLLTEDDVPLIIASGVSDGPTKNGMLISFALSFMYAQLLFKRIPFSLFDIFIFIVGTASLLAATSRAGLLSFGVVAIGGGLFAMIQALRKTQYRLSFLSIAFLAATGTALAAIIVVEGFDLDALIELRDPTADRYGLDAMLYKLTVFDDGSTDERLGTVAFFMAQLLESPLHFLSVGFGTGTFETMYGLNVHNSYLELSFTTGFLGFLLFICLVGHVVRKALSHPNALKIIPTLFALASVSVFMFAHDVLRGRLFWIALGLVAAFAYSYSTRDRPLAAIEGVPAVR